MYGDFYFDIERNSLKWEKKKKSSTNRCEEKKIQTPT